MSEVTGGSSLRERFTHALKEAMKAGDKRRLATVRLIQAALKDKDIEARGSGKGQASDEEVLALLQKMIKQRQESASIYEQAGRGELATQEKEEAEVITSFLPRQMDEAEMRAAITAEIAATGATGVKDMGKVIAGLRGKFAGRMDFAKASGLVKEFLAKG
ncbi:GatB/YqeY domain-containing protein [Chelatococcus sp. SYSU_G07232]|uniref:GatB/YqeY domain-containing protein n=1 Tax=Chelatococcus albus TaxID=3047466 RepID=A0ABT7AIP1_9HYPH|nr:GatB/YqeY domain-containing protein [Chelatococcus sp. SYSU_G07232]MDJ1159223.1 GatB/YqeY domain-containing protein [Chelatococcus sp. SYSU_G07232]